MPVTDYNINQVGTVCLPFTYTLLLFPLAHNTHFGLVSFYISWVAGSLMCVCAINAVHYGLER